MYEIAATLLTLAGLGGLTIALLRMRGVKNIIWIAYIHGVLALAAIAALVASLIVNYELLGAVALLAAVLGVPFGLVMFLQHRRGKFFALGILIGHVSLELPAIVFSWLTVFSLNP